MTVLRRLILAAALLAGPLMACKTLPFPEPHLEGEYGRLLHAWTREQALYQGLENRAFAQVIYLSPQLIEAQADLISGLRAEPSPARARTLERLRAEAAAPTFFAILRTPDRNWNDLESRTSVWRVALDDGVGQVEPEKVERLEKPWSAELQKLYPYLDEYAVAYRLRFPAVAAPAAKAAGASAPLVPALVMAGALGQMRFDWSVPVR